MFRLLVIHGREEQVFAAPEGEATLGSASENDIVLRIPGVSRRHALVRRCPGGVELVDRGSTNGILVERNLVGRTLLTPGLRVQIGEAWLELQELSSVEAEFALCLGDQSAREAETPQTTASVEPLLDANDSSPEAAALRLAAHLALVDINALEGRPGLIARLRAALGADVLVSVKRQRKGAIETLEADGRQLTADEEGSLGSFASDPRTWPPDEVRLKRVGAFLLAGRGSYFLAVWFPEESLAREAWRADFLRFLAARLIPEKPLRKVRLTEVRRALAATGGDKSETARILGISRQTVYNILDRRSSPKRSDS